METESECYSKKTLHKKQPFNAAVRSPLILIKQTNPYDSDTETRKKEMYRNSAKEEMKTAMTKLTISWNNETHGY